MPRALVGLEGDYGTVPARLTPVFRDEDELAGAAQLGPKLEDALARSRALVVVCSPAARASQWVDNEVRTFKRLNPDAPVFAVIAGGVPGEGEDGCFPDALLWEVDAAGASDRSRPLEPLAPDLQVLGKRVVKLKLIAGMLGGAVRSPQRSRAAPPADLRGDLYRRFAGADRRPQRTVADRSPQRPHRRARADRRRAAAQRGDRRA
ncbi:TIR domain-containing protein [Novosphingobium colocasiae]